MQTETTEETSTLERIGDGTKTGLAVIGLITVVVSVFQWKKVRKAYRDASQAMS